VKIKVAGRKTRRRRRRDRKTCDRCVWFKKRDRFTFSCHTRWGTFDVNTAEKIVRDGRPSRLMSVRSLRRLARRDGWDRDRHIKHYHVPHVHPHKALIFGTLRDAADGARIFLIEGHHRALRHLWEQRPAKFYILSAEETERITLRRRNRKPQISPRGISLCGRARARRQEQRRERRRPVRARLTTRRASGLRSAGPARAR
jgi:hypothetical protein